MTDSARQQQQMPRWRKLTVRWLVLALRLAVGATFVYSGFVKIIDVWGIGYKIDDYIEAFHWTWAAPFTGIVSVALPLFEFLAGLMLAIGSFRRAMVVALTACMAFMLPLSAYIMATDPVPDCGCFGDAWVISNTATFWKNVALTAALIYLLVRNHQLRSLYGPAVQWLTLTLPAVVAIAIMAWGYYFQPMLDFRPYKIGTQLVTASDSENDDDYRFIYEKDGERQEFSINNLPDSTWTFVDRIDADEITPLHQASAITAYDGDESVADNLISPRGVTVLLLIPDIDGINSLTNFRLNDLNDHAAVSGYQMICLTGSNEKELNQWRELSMADYPVYRMDDSQLKQIARGNPAVVIVKDGRIAYKSSFFDFYAQFDEATHGKSLNIKVYTDTVDDNEELLYSLLIILAIAMAALLAVNRTPLALKLIRMSRKPKAHQQKKP